MSGAMTGELAQLDHLAEVTETVRPPVLVNTGVGHKTVNEDLRNAHLTSRPCRSVGCVAGTALKQDCVVESGGHWSYDSFHGAGPRCAETEMTHSEIRHIAAQRVHDVEAPVLRDLPRSLGGTNNRAESELVFFGERIGR